MTEALNHPHGSSSTVLQLYSGEKTEPRGPPCEYMASGGGKTTQTGWKHDSGKRVGEEVSKTSNIFSWPPLGGLGERK